MLQPTGGKKAIYASQVWVDPSFEWAPLELHFWGGNKSFKSHHKFTKVQHDDLCGISLRLLDGDINYLCNELQLPHGAGNGVQGLRLATWI